MGCVTTHSHLDTRLHINDGELCSIDSVKFMMTRIDVNKEGA
jgi:hypothetical protein